MRVYAVVMMVVLTIMLFLIYSGQETNKAIEGRPTSVNPSTQQMNEAIGNLNK